MTAPVRILYFAWMREQIGRSADEVALPEGVRTVGALIDHLAAREPALQRLFENRKPIRCAVNQEFADFSHPLAPGDEVGFFPPVTGG